jgi:hypothetical protein
MGSLFLLWKKTLMLLWLTKDWGPWHSHEKAPVTWMVWFFGWTQLTGAAPGLLWVTAQVSEVEGHSSGSQRSMSVNKLVKGIRETSTWGSAESKQTWRRSCENSAGLLLVGRELELIGFVNEHTTVTYIFHYTVIREKSVSLSLSLSLSLSHQA